jgi:hypothetical protein
MTNQFLLNQSRLSAEVDCRRYYCMLSTDGLIRHSLPGLSNCRFGKLWSLIIWCQCTTDNDCYQRRRPDQLLHLWTETPLFSSGFWWKNTEDGWVATETTTRGHSMAPVPKTAYQARNRKLFDHEEPVINVRVKPFVCADEKEGIYG